nr:hypothetical protein CFP56_11573 [Quercus suber]
MDVLRPSPHALARVCSRNLRVIAILLEIWLRVSWSYLVCPAGSSTSLPATEDPPRLESDHAARSKIEFIIRQPSLDAQQWLNQDYTTSPAYARLSFVDTACACKELHLSCSSMTKTVLGGNVGATFASARTWNPGLVRADMGRSQDRRPDHGVGWKDDRSVTISVPP